MFTVAATNSIVCILRSLFIRFSFGKSLKEMRFLLEVMIKTSSTHRTWDEHRD